jgi:hypothetical protein
MFPQVKVPKLIVVGDHSGPVDRLYDSRQLIQLAKTKPPARDGQTGVLKIANINGSVLWHLKAHAVLQTDSGNF